MSKIRIYRGPAEPEDADRGDKKETEVPKGSDVATVFGGKLEAFSQEILIIQQLLTKKQYDKMRDAIAKAECTLTTLLELCDLAVVPGEVLDNTRMLQLSAELRRLKSLHTLRSQMDDSRAVVLRFPGA